MTTANWMGTAPVDMNGTQLEVVPVTRVENGKVYLSGSKVAINFPGRLLIVTPPPAEKYVKIMPEIMANPIWTSEGTMMSWAALNLPDDYLVNKLVIWNAACEEDEAGIMASQLKHRGHTLARYVKHYKPDWIVAYAFDGDDSVEIDDPEPMWKAVTLLP